MRKKQYSIAEARANLPTVVREAEVGLEIDLTRRGKPVAVVMSRREYERLRSRRSHFREAYRDFLTRFSLDEVGLDEGWIESLRDRSPGRRVPL
jgi:prevent-host-death family protein